MTDAPNLEPWALGGERRAKSDDQMQSACLASIAISLKRIADAVTGEGANILTQPINSYGEGIGDAIQGQMVRGQRGIDQYEGR